MNWTGGRLQRHSKINGRKSSMIAKQRQHFAKVRTKLQNGSVQLSPFHSSLLTTGWLEANAAEEVQNDCRTLVANKQRQLEDFPSTAPLARKLGTLSRNSAAEGSSSNYKDKRPRSTIRPSGAAPKTTEQFALEATRRQLLDKEDWVGLESTRPLHLDFASSNGRSNVGKRRKIDPQDKLRRQALIGRERVPSIQGQYMMSGALRGAVPPVDDNETVRIRIGDDALTSQVSGQYSHCSLVSAGSSSGKSGSTSFGWEELHMPEDFTNAQHLGAGGETEAVNAQLMFPMDSDLDTMTSRFSLSNQAGTTTSQDRITQCSSNHRDAFPTMRFQEGSCTQSSSFQGLSSPEELASTLFDHVSPRISPMMSTSNSPHTTRVSPDTTGLTTSSDLTNSPHATASSHDNGKSSSSTQLPSTDRAETASPEGEVEVLWTRLFNVPAVTAIHENYNLLSKTLTSLRAPTQPTTELLTKDNASNHITSIPRAEASSPDPQAPATRACGKEPVLRDQNEIWRTFVFGDLPSSPSPALSPSLSPRPRPYHNRTVIPNGQADCDLIDSDLLSLPSPSTRRGLASSLDVQASDSKPHQTPPNESTRIASQSTIVKTSTSTPPSRPSSVDNASTVPAVLRTTRPPLSTLHSNTTHAALNPDPVQAQSADSSPDPLTAGVSIPALGQRTHGTNRHQTHGKPPRKKTVFRRPTPFVGSKAVIHNADEEEEDIVRIGAGHAWHVKGNKVGQYGRRSRRRTAAFGMRETHPDEEIEDGEGSGG